MWWMLHELSSHHFISHWSWHWLQKMIVDELILYVPFFNTVLRNQNIMLGASSGSCFKQMFCYRMKHYFLENVLVIFITVLFLKHEISGATQAFSTQEMFSIGRKLETAWSARTFFPREWTVVIIELSWIYICGVVCGVGVKADYLKKDLGL